MNRILSRSATLSRGDEVSHLGELGVDVINLAGGIAVFEVPPSVKNEAQGVVSAGPFGLTDSRGIPELREALCMELHSETGLRFNPEQVVVTVGAKAATMASILALVDVGDEVLLPDPTWVSYEPWIIRAGAIPVRFGMGRATGFKPDWSEVRKLLSPRTRLIVLTTPHNPTGTVLSFNDLSELGEILASHSALLVSDESNAGIEFDGIQHVTPLQVPSLKERTILIRSFSKTFAMPGWRVGFVLASHRHIDAILATHEHAVSCVPAIIQAGALAMLRSPEKQAFRSEMLRAYDERRQVLIGGLNKIPGVRCHYPEGAFNAFPDFSIFSYSSAELAGLLLTKAGVLCVPGDAFGRYGEGHIRMAFTLPPARLQEALERISRVCATLSPNGGRQVSCAPTS